jgi:hypothetical protein
MFVITKITQRYDARQDRIALTMQDAGNRVLLLWLTQRLANRVAGTLAKWLDEDVKAQASGQTSFNLHTFEQWAARAKMRSGQPVDSAAPQSEGLLQEVRLARSPKDCRLTFRWGSTGTARLHLDPTQLRQWLIILHRQFRKAGWSRHVWPDWITVDEETGTSGPMSQEVN